MAKGMALVLWMVPLLAVSCCLCLDAAEETEQVLTAAQIEKLAQRRVMEEVQKELD